MDPEQFIASSTIDSTATLAVAERVPGLMLTILWHPQSARIGAQAPAPFSAGIQLSRLEPTFSDGLPLADPHASRSPLLLTPSGERVSVQVGRPGLRFSVDGEKASSGAILTAVMLRRGVVLGLGRKGPLVLVESEIRAPQPDRHGLIGTSAALQRVRNEIDRYAAYDYPVLVVGPTGTGKEVVCRALHAASRRSQAPLVAVNMAALSPGTAHSELFGHARGSFTGAAAASEGLFVRANRGTLLLDEIGVCPVELQARLLRALETGTVRPVGGAERAVDVRLLAATDEPLAKAIEEGRFRRALYYRLAHGRIVLTPLSQRPADVVAQFLHFLEPALAAEGKALKGTEWLTRQTVLQLVAHDWPGNTRELRALAQQAAIRYGSEAVCGPLFSDQPSQSGAEAPRGMPVPKDGSGGDERIRTTLAECGYRIRETTQKLGISRNTLRRKMATLGIPRPGELSRESIEAALEAHPQTEAAAEHLKVSAYGLRQRMKGLGLLAEDQGA